MHEIVIVGAGGFAREVHHWAVNTFSDDAFTIKGFLSSNPHDLERFEISCPIIGDVETHNIQEEDRFLLAIGDIDTRKRVVNCLKKGGAQFLTLIHPTAIVTETATLGEGVIVCPFATVSDHCQLGDFVLMNFYSSCGHDAKIGNYCVLSPYSTINGYATVEDEVFLGTHSTVAPYKRVGRRTRISANSAAMYDIPALSFVVGVPGKHRIIYGHSD